MLVSEASARLRTSLWDDWVKIVVVPLWHPLSTVMSRPTAMGALWWSLWVTAALSYVGHAVHRRAFLGFPLSVWGSEAAACQMHGCQGLVVVVVVVWDVSVTGSLWKGGGPAAATCISALKLPECPRARHWLPISSSPDAAVWLDVRSETTPSDWFVVAWRHRLSAVSPPVPGRQICHH